MSKNDFILIQPINVDVNEDTFNYGLLYGIYYPYLVAKKVGKDTCKDVLFGVKYQLVESKETKFDDVKQIEEIAFLPAKKVLDIDKNVDNMRLVNLYLQYRGAIPQEELEGINSKLREYFNRVDYAYSDKEVLPPAIFKTVLEFAVGDIYNANVAASFVCEAKLDKENHK